jgi:hypothetical protein
MLLIKSLFTAIFFALLAIAASSQPILKDSAIAIVKDQIIGDDTVNFNIYMHPAIYSAEFCICRNGDTIFNPYNHSRLFFIDEMPEYA